MNESSNQSRFNEMVQEHFGIVQKVAMTYCRNQTDQADLVQEILLQLWRAWPRYDSSRLFSTWMYRVCLNVAISQVRTAMRQKQRFIPFCEESHNPAAQTQDDALAQKQQLIFQILESLDGMNKALFMLYMDERSYRQIAEILGITVSNVGTKIGRLKEMIRESFSIS
jgi:RNA polymerase sigma factor (sigma-70 family)